MDDLEHLEVLESIQELNRKSADQVVIETLYEINKTAKSKQVGEVNRYVLIILT